jgi:GNAT superfamily N-acetyltransferase
MRIGMLRLSRPEAGYRIRDHRGKGPPVTAIHPAIRFTIETMSERDLPAAYALSKTVGWPHRLEDWQQVLSVGEGVIAMSEGRLLGTSMWWRYEDKIARIGMVIVEPGIQRVGIGRVLMNETLARIPEKTVVLNATQAGEKLYRELGFNGVGSIVQHQGASYSAPLIPLRPGERIRPMGRNDASRLIELDALGSGARRDAVIAALIENAEGVVLDEAGETVGFALCRRFGLGHAIGPVVARDTASAKALAAHWIGSKAGMFMRIDVPGESGLSDWLNELGLARTSFVVTMARGELPEHAGAFHTFAAINQALG